MVQFEKISTKVLMILLLLTSIAACDRWFGSEKELTSEEKANINPLIPRRSNSAFGRPEPAYQGVAINEVTDMELKSTRSGTILVVHGVAARQGAYNAILVPSETNRSRTDGVLEFQFDITYPQEDTSVGPVAARRIVLAQSLSNDLLEPVTLIRVIAANNVLERSYN